MPATCLKRGVESLFIFTVYLLIKSYSFIYRQCSCSYSYIHTYVADVLSKESKNDDSAIPIYV